MTNFGVELFLNTFSTTPSNLVPAIAVWGNSADLPEFSGFVFKLRPIWIRNTATGWRLCGFTGKFEKHDGESCPHRENCPPVTAPNCPRQNRLMLIRAMSSVWIIRRVCDWGYDLPGRSWSVRVFPVSHQNCLRLLEIPTLEVQAIPQRSFGAAGRGSSANYVLSGWGEARSHSSGGGSIAIWGGAASACKMSMAQTQLELLPYTVARWVTVVGRR